MYICHHCEKKVTYKVICHELVLYAEKKVLEVNVHIKTLYFHEPCYSVWFQTVYVPRMSKAHLRN